MRHVGFSRLFLRGWCDGKGARRLTRDWWMQGVRRSELRNAPFRETSRKASKEGGAKNGEGEGRSPELFEADRREARSLPVVHSLLAIVVHALSGLW